MFTTRSFSENRWHIVLRYIRNKDAISHQLLVAVKSEEIFKMFHQTFPNLGRRQRVVTEYE
jgi:hypothetical protein